MYAVSNSSPLIYLTKLSKLELLRKLYRKILIPKEVYEEVVVKGKENYETETLLIEKFIDEGFIIVKDSVVLKKEVKALHLGESKTINLCLKSKLKDILIDDKEAYKICKLLGLNPVRTTSILLEFVKLKLIKKEEFKELLIKLSEEGYFITIDVFNYLLEEVEKVDEVNEEIKRRKK